jgi:hypothetical protein
VWFLGLNNQILSDNFERLDIRKKQLLLNQVRQRYMPVITGFERLNFMTVAMKYHRFKGSSWNDGITTLL